MSVAAEALLGPEQVAALERLLAQLGLPQASQLLPLTGGANNRVFRLETDKGPLLLKAYFQHPQDLRDRLGAEFAFCLFAWGHGVEVTPRPLAADAQANLALYEFIEGQPIRPGEVTAREVQAAADFYLALNRHRDEAGELPVASEACFSVAEHLGNLRRRVARLSEVTSPEALAFVQGELSPLASAVVGAAEAQWGEKPLTASDRRVSPSDFGFHNALRESDGRLRFLDFEYAGWDDPAKLVCDFFCQPALPVPLGQWDAFTVAVAEDLSDPAAHLARFAALLPVYRLKWCCMLLNDFLPTGSARRAFASGKPVTADQRATQLGKARELLEKVRT